MGEYLCAQFTVSCKLHVDMSDSIFNYYVERLMTNFRLAALRVEKTSACRDLKKYASKYLNCEVSIPL